MTLVAVGSCSITASQAAGGNYAAATPVTNSFTITPASQTLTFTQPGDVVYGSGSVTLVATGESSGNAVSFASTTPSICTVSGTTVTLVGVGSCSITASQAAGGNYAAATSVTKSFTITADPIVIAGGSMPDGKLNVPYSASLSATGGKAPYKWSLVSGTLPAGLSLGPDGTVSGTPSEPGAAAFTAGVTDSLGGTAKISVAFAITADPITIAGSSLADGKLNVPYSDALSATGGKAPYKWALLSGTLPAGLSLGADGIVSGTPSEPGAAAFTAGVTDSLGGTAKISVAFTISADPVTIASSTVPDGKVNVSYSAGLSAAGGKAPYKWSLLSGALPAGMSFGADGSLSGTPSVPGPVSFVAVATDSLGSIAKATVAFTITPDPLTITGSSLPDGFVKIPYSASLSAVGGKAPFQWALVSGSMPAGLSFGTNGAISGTPTASGSASFTAGVTDSLGGTAKIALAFTIKPEPVSIPSGSLPDGTVGVPYSASLSAAGGTTPYKWSLLSGSLPDGLSFGTNGSVSGTPSAPGGVGFAAVVTDASGGTANIAVAFAIKAAPMVISSPSSLAPGMVGVEYPGVQLAVTGGTPPYKWSLSSGALPTGIALDSGGTIAGTPTVAGSFSAGLTVKDSAGTAASSSSSVTVRALAADLIVASSSVSFEILSGATSAPSPQSISVQSTVIAQQIGFSVQMSPAVAWLTISSGTKTPDGISIGISTAALALSAGSYATSVKVTCSTGSCSGSVQTIQVSLKVTSLPPQLKVGTPVLSFTTSTQNLAPMSGSISVQNVGGGSLSFTSVTCGAPWCVVGSGVAAISGGGSSVIPVTVTPGSVAPGSYRTSVDISSSAGRSSVPVSLSISQNASMTVSPSGSQFSMPEGSAPGNSSGTILVSTNSIFGISLNASLLPGADWLKLSASTASTSLSQPATFSYFIDPVIVGTLKQGAYYGQISIGGAGLSNSPQSFQVILNVQAATSRPRPDPQPAGLLFQATLGGANPAPQTVTLFTSAPTATQFQASTSSDGGWLAISPTLSSTSQASPAATTAQVNITGLKQGIYSGFINYAFAGNAVRAVNVTLVVAAPGSSAGSALVSAYAPTGVLRPNEACAPTTMAAVQTGIVSSFSAPASWPIPLALKLVDDCGRIVTGAQIITTFTNGDPPLSLSLVDANKGLYAGTWTPRRISSTLTINARILAKGYKDYSTQLVGSVTSNEAPSVFANGTVHAFSPLVGAPLAPGNIISVYGSNLAVLTGVPAALPLPTTVNGTQVLIGGIKAPIYFTSPGQVNAQIPYELTPNQEYQVVISANGALTTPDPIQLTTAVPGFAAYADGTAIAQHADGRLVTAKSPVIPGEIAIAYLAGLGATGTDVTSGGASPGDVLATPTAIPTLTVGGANAKISFVGLTPGLVGLYQINFEVPAGLSNRNPTITVTQAGVTSQPVILPYAPISAPASP